MSRPSSAEFLVHGSPANQSGQADDPLAHGPVRISGTVIGEGARWYSTTDRLGWTTIVLLEDEEGWDAVGTLQRCAAQNLPPARTALALRDGLRELSVDYGRRTGLAVARIGPYGQMIELVNTSLPTVLHWDPVEGLSPYEPLFFDLDSMTAYTDSEFVSLRPGGALVLTTEAVLPHDAGFWQLRGFARALGLDPCGGTLADAPASELARLLRTSWGCRRAPAGIVVIGIPSAIQQVA
jgi:hypothetical protein